MASTYSPNLRLELIGTGEQQGTWGSTTNTNLGTLLEEAIGGYVSVTVTDGADTTLSTNNGSADQSRNMTINLTGALTAARNVICPAIEKVYIVKNATTGGFAVTFKVSGQTGVSIPNGSTYILYVNGTDAVLATGTIAAQNSNNVSITGGSITGITDLAIADGGTGASTAAGAATNLGLGTGDSPQFAAVNIGNATDTTITRVSAGVIAVEGKTVVTETGGQTVQFAAGTVSAPSITTTGDTNTGIYFPAADTIAFTEGGTEAMRIDSAGNLGLGVTPSAWNSSAKAFEMPSGGIWGFGISVVSVTNNAFYNASDNFIYKANNFATSYEQRADNGAHRWLIAPSGTAGNTITFTVAMTLDASGNLGIGTTSPGARLDVASGSAVLAANFNSTNASGVYIRFQNSGTAIGDLGSGGNLFAGGTAGDFGLTSRSGNLVFGTSSTERMRIDSSGNVGIGTSTFGTSAAKVLSIGTGTAPSTGPADTIQIFSTDLSAGNTILSLRTEGTPVNANTTAAATHRIAVRINGTVYYLLANTAA